MKRGEAFIMEEGGRHLSSGKLSYKHKYVVPETDEDEKCSCPFSRLGTIGGERSDPTCPECYVDIGINNCTQGARTMTAGATYQHHPATCRTTDQET